MAYVPPGRPSDELQSRPLTPQEQLLSRSPAGLTPMEFEEWMRLKGLLPKPSLPRGQHNDDKRKTRIINRLLKWPGY